MADLAVDSNVNHKPENEMTTVSSPLMSSWVLDYYSHRFWREFKSQGTVDSRTERSFLQGLLREEIERTEDRCKLINFMQLIVCLADGQEVDVQYSAEQEGTPLEEAFQCFDKAVDGYEGPVKEVEAVKDMLRLQAVLVCCRAEQYDQARMVFHRLWMDENATHSQGHSTQQRLDSFIEARKVNTRFLDQHTYQDFLQKAIALLQKIYDTFPAPFLLNLERKYKQRQAEMLAGDNGDSPSTSSMEPSSSKPDNGPTSESSSPIQGFRRLRRLSGEFSSQLLEDNSELLLDEDHEGTGESPVKRGRYYNSAESAQVDEDGKDLLEDQKDEAGRRVGGPPVQPGHTDPSAGSSDMDEVDTNHTGPYGNQRADNMKRGKGVKRKVPDTSSASSDDASSASDDGYREGCADTDAGISSKTSRNRNNSSKYKPHRFCTSEMLHRALMRLGLKESEWREIVAGGSQVALPQATTNGVMQHNLISRKRPNIQTLPSSPQTPPAKTSTPVHGSHQQNSTHSPKPQTSRSSDDHVSCESNASSDSLDAESRREEKAQASFIKFQKTPPRKGKSIRDCKYQPNRVVDGGNDQATTSQEETTAWSDSDLDSSVSSHAHPILNTPHLRRSLDPDTWQGNHMLRRAPVRKQPWTEEEVNTLKKALRRFGPGKWSQMLLAYDFNGRTNVNLKDKWRNMVKNEEI